MCINLDDPAFSDEDYLEQIRKTTEQPNNDVKVQDGKLLIRPSFGHRYLSTDLSPWKLVVPNSLISSLLVSAHSPPSASHMGITKTIELLQRHFYWPKMHRDVREFINNCVVCKMTKAPNVPLRPPMGSAFEVTRPFQYLYIDFLGPFPRSRNHNTYLLVVLDKYSKFLFLKPFKEASTTTLCIFVEQEIFHLFGVPEFITTDNGPQFKSLPFRHLLFTYGVQARKTPFHSPQSNAAERVNRTVIAALRAYIGDRHTEWDVHLSQVGATMRNVIHSSTSFSPHFLVFGQHRIGHGSEYKLRRLLGCCDNSEADVFTTATRLDRIRDEVLRHLQAAHFKGERAYNRTSRPRSFTVGQPVYVRTYVLSSAVRNFSAKLAPKFVPGIVVEKIGQVAYRLTDRAGKALGIYHAHDIRA